MIDDTTTKDSIKIKMDTYTRHLYEDFIGALSDRLRVTADDYLSKLSEISQSLDDLHAQDRGPEEEISKKLDDLVEQLEAIVKEQDKELLSSLSLIMDAYKTNLQTSVDTGQSQTVASFETIKAQIVEVGKELEAKRDNIIESVNQNLTALKEQLNTDLESVVKDNSEAVTKCVNEYTLSKSEVLTESITSSFRGVSSELEEMQDGLKRELAQGSEKLDSRIAKVIGIASKHIRRIQLTEQLIYKSLKTSMDSFLEYRVHIEEKFSCIESNNLEQKDVSNQSFELNKLISLEISKLNAAGKDVNDKVDALSTMLSNHHNELLKSFNGLQQEIVSMHQGLCDKNDAFATTISDYFNEISQTLSFLQQELISRHNDLSVKNDKLTEQVKTNQELLIWILTPWYKKIFRRKNGKPQILVTKPVAEPEDN